ncbi:MAG: amidohydrolase [Bacilli bacterium]|jgi:predicted amidohydrolase YtcJ|nr:amidohydrolase [Bacilli bacterium]
MEAYVNGIIHSMDNHQIYQAMLIDKGIIKALGSNEEINKLINKQTIINDLNKQVVLPGFNDSHLHALMSATKMKQIDLSKAQSIDDIIRIVKNNISSNMAEDEWIIGYGWNQDYFETKSFFTNKDLDCISTTNPICLIRACVHVCIVNSKALEIINLDIDNYINDPEMNIGLNKEGELNGLFGEKALDLVYTHFKTLSLNDIKNLILAFTKHLNSYGITSIQSDDFTALSNISYEMIIKAYQELALSNELNIKVYQQCLLPTVELFKEFLHKGYRTKQQFNNYTIGPLKLLQDGSLGARSAYLQEPYHDDPINQGIRIYDDETLLAFGNLAQENKIQIAIHGIGDGAIASILRMYERLQEDYDISNSRHGIVHTQITDQFLIKRIKDTYSVIYAQPIFLHYDIHIVKERVGLKKALTSYAFKTLIKQQTSVSLGTDSPVESVNPFDNIYCAVTRKDLNNNMQESFNKKECLSIYEAINAYTNEGAYQSFSEDTKGNLMINKEADFIIINQDIFTIDHDLIRATKVLKTYLNGQLVYEAK